jgi:hypothetical protein
MIIMVFTPFPLLAGGLCALILFYLCSVVPLPFLLLLSIHRINITFCLSFHSLHGLLAGLSSTLCLTQYKSFSIIILYIFTFFFSPVILVMVLSKS